jgi:putative transposase
MMSLQGGLTIERMCRLARVSRAGFYRWQRVEAPGEEESEVSAAIHEVVLKHRGRYGYRRVSLELRRRGMVVNHKRVARLMREDNLFAEHRLPS